MTTTACIHIPHLALTLNYAETCPYILQVHPLPPLSPAELAFPLSAEVALYPPVSWDSGSVNNNVNTMSMCASTRASLSFCN